jgi:hypothetical protein
MPLAESRAPADKRELGASVTALSLLAVVVAVVEEADDAGSLRADIELWIVGALICSNSKCDGPAKPAGRRMRNGSQLKSEFSDQSDTGSTVFTYITFTTGIQYYSCHLIRWP